MKKTKNIHYYYLYLLGQRWSHLTQNRTTTREHAESQAHRPADTAATPGIRLR